MKMSLTTPETHMDWQCPSVTCGRRYPRFAHLQRHFDTVHMPFKSCQICKICGYEMISFPHLCNHVENTHGKPRQECHKFIQSLVKRNVSLMPPVFASQDPSIVDCVLKISQYQYGLFLVGKVVKDKLELQRFVEQFIFAHLRKPPGTVSSRAPPDETLQDFPTPKQSNVQQLAPQQLTAPQLIAPESTGQKQQPLAKPTWLLMMENSLQNPMNVSSISQWNDNPSQVQSDDCHISESQPESHSGNQSGSEVSDEVLAHFVSRFKEQKTTGNSSYTNNTTVTTEIGTLSIKLERPTSPPLPVPRPYSPAKEDEEEREIAEGLQTSFDEEDEDEVDDGICVDTGGNSDQSSSGNKLQ